MNESAPPKPAIKPHVQLVRESERRRLDGGGKRMPTIFMPAAAAADLDYLVQCAYGSSKTNAVLRAISEAAAAQRRKAKRTTPG